MNTTVQLINWQGLAWSFVPVVAAIVILVRWRVSAGTAVYAVARMLVQLLAVGLVLTYIFDAEHAGIIVLVLLVMITTASWIAIRPIRKKGRRHYRDALIAIVVGGGLTLALVTQLVIGLEPWYSAVLRMLIRPSRVRRSVAPPPCSEIAPHSRRLPRLSSSSCSSTRVKLPASVLPTRRDFNTPSRSAS